MVFVLVSCSNPKPPNPQIRGLSIRLLLSVLPWDFVIRAKRPAFRRLTARAQAKARRSAPHCAATRPERLEKALRGSHDQAACKRLLGGVGCHGHRLSQIS